MTRYANVDKLVKAGYNMLSNDLEQHDPIDWILAELDGFVIEVPTPHGRLIDAAELMLDILDAQTNQPELAEVYDEDYHAVLDWLRAAPTVIEAENE